MNLKIYLESSCKPMADRKKLREVGNTKNWISREQKEFFRWNEKGFS